MALSNYTSIAWFGFVILALCVYFSWNQFSVIDRQIHVTSPVDSTEKRQETTSTSSEQISPSPELARVVAVPDGDSLVVVMILPDAPSREQAKEFDGREIRVRLEGIDCPEFGQPFHRTAKQFTSDLCLGKHVTVKSIEQDKYGRSVSHVFLGSETDLSLELLRAGLAWHFVRYNNQPEFAAAEASAKSQRIGLWQDDMPVEPWVWRKAHPYEPKKN